LGKGGRAEKRCRVKITFYPAETLSKGKDNFDSILTGVADISWVSLAYTPGLFPLTELFFVPHMGNISAETCTRIYHELYEKFPQIRAEYSKVKVLWTHIGSPAGLLSAKKPIRRLEDLEKVVIRAVGPNGETAKALGASPVSMTRARRLYGHGKRECRCCACTAGGAHHIQAERGNKVYYHWVSGRLRALFDRDESQGLECFAAGYPADHGRGEPKIAFLNSRGWDKKEQQAIELMRSKGEVVTLSAEEAEKWRARLMPLWISG